MKGIVLEIRDKTAAVLREDGVIVRTRQKCAVGDTIELTAEKIRFPGSAARNIAAAAAVFVLAAAGGGVYTYQNVSACSYVSLDVNPSMEFVLNRRNRVIEAAACDDDAESIVKLINEGSIKNMEIAEAVETACDVLKENGYLADEETNYILLNVSSDQEARKEELTEEIMALFDERENLEAVATDSSVDDRNKARGLGISTGMYQEIRMIENGGSEDNKEIDVQTIRKYKEKTLRECLQEAGQIPARSDMEKMMNEPAGQENNFTVQNAGSPESRPEDALPSAAGQGSGTLPEKTENNPASGSLGNPDVPAGLEMAGNAADPGNAVSPGMTGDPEAGSAENDSAFSAAPAASPGSEAASDTGGPAQAGMGGSPSGEGGPSGGEMQMGNFFH